MKKVLWIQPCLVKYRIKLFEDVGKKVHLEIVYSASNGDNDGYGQHQIDRRSGVRVCIIDTIKILHFNIYFQKSLLKRLFVTRPNCVVVFANPRFISYWLLLFVCKAVRVPLFSHGHGLFKKRNPGIGLRFVFGLICRMSHRYICYTESVLKSLEVVAPKKKLVVIENVLDNEFNKKKTVSFGSVNNILFLGRLRRDCCVVELISIIQRYNRCHNDQFKLHIVGDGDLKGKVLKLLDSTDCVVYHGEVYDNKEIARIAETCLMGVFLGNIGLSVVHYFSLSLPVLTHNDINRHGPEISYVRNNFNGFLVDSCEIESEVFNCLQRISTCGIESFQEAAFNTYSDLLGRSMADKFLDEFHKVF